MAFAIDEVGIENSTTQVLFDAPPIIEDRHAEGGPGVAQERSIDNTPVVVQYQSGQNKAELKIRVEQLDRAQIDLIDALIDAGGLVTVKLKPNDATTIVCAFAARSEQQFEPYNGPYPESDKVGGTLTPILTAYRVTLMLYRM